MSVAAERRTAPDPSSTAGLDVVLERRRRMSSDSPVFRAAAPLILAILVVVGWQVVVDVGNTAPSILPSPLRVLQASVTSWEQIWANTVPTLQVTGMGLAASLVVSIGAATAMSFLPWLRNATLPLLIAAQSIPVIVLAPLFVIWFGFGPGPKVGLIVIASVFPMTIALLQGFLSADPDAATLMRSLGANRLKIFLRLQVPSALPFFFTGLRIIASFAVLAAVFAETVGSQAGLGIFMTIQKNLLRTDLVLAAAAVIIALGLLLFSLTYVLEAIAMPWERRRKAMRSE